MAFQSLTYLSAESDANVFHYRLVDSAFTDYLSIDPNIYDRISLVAYEMLIIQAYEKRQLAVPKNLALFYLNYFKGRPGKDIDALVRAWRDDIDELCPQFEYSKKYYACVVRQLKQLSYGKNIKRYV